MPEPVVFPASVRLTEQAEEEWERLAKQVELAQGFWLGFVFSVSPLVVATLRERLAATLTQSSSALAVVRPDSVQLLPGALDDVFRQLEGTTVWLEAVELDGPARAWEQAWRRLLARLNERRDRARRHLGAGLLIVVRPELKPVVRDVAPDLWTLRSLVLEPEPTPTGLGELWPSLMALTDHAKFFPLRPSESGFRLSPDIPAGAADLLRESASLQAGGRTRQARVPAKRAVALLERRGGPDLAVALLGASTVAAALGDADTAAKQLDRALSELEAHGQKPWLELLDLRFELAVLRGETAKCLELALSLCSQARLELETQGLSGRTVWNLSASLDRLAVSRYEAGDLTGALAEAVENRELCEHAVAEVAQSPPEILRLLALACERLGFLRLQNGSLNGALLDFRAAVRALGSLGDAAGVAELENLHRAWQLVGDAELSLGSVQEAFDAYLVELQLAQVLINEAQDAQTGLVARLSALLRVGVVQQLVGGERAGHAPVVFREALSLAERLAEHGTGSGEMDQAVLQIRQELRARLAAVHEKPAPV
jgi:tetratricopeptide (TPR) repeat protein